MRIFLILLILFIYPHGLWSQIFNGRVLEENTRKPVEAVSVSILDASNIGLCYTICGDDGYFRFTCNDIKDARFIHFSCLGYESKMFDIRKFKNGQEIFLSQSEIKLKEVVVKYQPIKQFGDTLDYDVRGFRLAQDRNIRDILKRLPGIEVEENGKVKYQGKEINKFYVENLDLTDGKYNLISNNLSAKAVKTVQIFEQHQPISALRETDFSDQAALNLLLEDDAKGKLFGTIDLGVGFENKIEDPIWENRIIGMIFNNKLQEISVYKNANNGIDIKEDLIDFGTGVSFKVPNMTTKEVNVFNSLEVPQNVSFKKKRFFFNDTHYFSTNTLTKIDENKLFRIQASYLHEKEKQRGDNSTVYFLPNETLLVTEDTKIKNLTNQIEGRFTFDSNSDKNYIKNTLSINTLFANSDGLVNSEGNIQQKTNLDKIILSDEFSLVRKINKDKVFKINSVNEFNRLPQQISIYPGLYEELTGEAVADEYMTQNATLQSFNSHSFSSFSHPLAIFRMDYNLGVNLKTQLLESSPDNKTAFFLNNFSDSLSNHLRFTETNVYISPIIKYQREYINIVLTLTSTLKHLYKNDILVDYGKQNKTIFLVQPTFNLNYDVNAFWRLGFNSRYSKNYNNIHSLYSGYILKSYRYVLSYSDDITYQSAFDNSLFINYKQPIKGIFINASSTYSSRKRNNLTQNDFNGILQKSNNINREVTDNGLTILFNMSKTLPFLSSVLDFKYFHISSDYTQFVLDKQTTNNTAIHNLNLSFTIAPTKIMNVEGGVNFSFQRLKRVLPDIKKYTPIRDYKFELAVNIIPNKKIHFSWNNDLYYNNTAKSSFAYFTDISASLKTSKNEIQLFINNILNEAKFEKWSLGSFSESRYFTFLHKRQIFVKYIFNF